MHMDVLIFPPFCSYTSVTCAGQTRLQTPHFVHFSSSFSICSKGAHLKPLNLLTTARETPVGQKRHQKRLKTNEDANVKPMKTRAIASPMFWPAQKMMSWT